MTRRNEPDNRGDAEFHDLPDAELEVLAALWQSGQATARDLREHMASYRPMTHGSMVTLLKRLEQKQLVSRRKGTIGKAFVYEPTRGPKRTYRRIMRDLHERIFGGSGVAMVTSLFESRPPTADELEELQCLLDRLRKQHTEKGDRL